MTHDLCIHHDTNNFKYKYITDQFLYLQSDFFQTLEQMETFLMLPEIRNTFTYSMLVCMYNNLKIAMWCMTILMSTMFIFIIKDFIIYYPSDLSNGCGGRKSSKIYPSKFYAINFFPALNIWQSMIIIFDFNYTSVITHWRDIICTIQK